jgi:hypothetical protein
MSEDWANRFETKFNELQSETWKELKAKLDSLLLSTKFQHQNLAEYCTSLGDLSHEQRVQSITDNWGSNFCLTKAMPLLLQLKYIEEN